MRKLIIISIIFLLISGITGCSFFGRAPERVGLIPLDSRPANTQYPQLLGRMTNKQVEIPYDYLDNFLEPAKTDNLWSWLESNSKNFKKIIINTNELFNGSLIASRHPQAYADLEKKIADFEAFCRKNQDKEIIVISILPRLLPSQFTHLWNYREPLVAYAQKIDKNHLEGKEMPVPPQNIPKDILNEYLSIYEYTQVLVENLIAFTDSGLIDHYLIGQDDAEQYGLSNKIVRELTPLFNEKVQFVHGADEHTMLALTRELPFKESVGVNIEYTNADLREGYFPFEAAPLDKVITAKLNYLQVQEDSKADKKIIVHNDPQTVNELKNMVANNQPAYLGIMDIAYTNQGDTALLDFFLQPEVWPKVQSYAGWNTTGNTIGTELAHAVSYQFLAENYKKYKKPAQSDAVRAYLEFKYIRIAEDLVYQGILRKELNERLIGLNINPHHIEEENYQKANEILAQLYAPYEEKLAQAFLGEYRIGVLNFTVEKVSSEIELPWARTFEAKVVPEFVIGIHN